MRSFRFPSLVLLLALLLCASVAQGQSGRRPSQPTGATPVPEKNPALVSSETDTNKSWPKIRILVGRQPTSRHLLSEDTIYAAFVQRLNEQKQLEAVAIGDLRKREDAVKRARAETKQPVVVLQLEIDSFQEGAIVLNSPDLKIRYLVFAPVTGKEECKGGRVYYQSIGGARARKDAWPSGPPIKITPEAAAIAAADGLYDWLLLKAGIKER